MRICEKCGKEIEENFESCWRCADASEEVGPGASIERSEVAPVIWAVLYRCLLAASFTLLAAQVWSLGGRPREVVSVMSGVPLTLMTLCGVVLFFSSFAVLGKQRGLAICGFIVGGLCMVWIRPLLFNL